MSFRWTWLLVMSVIVCLYRQVQQKKHIQTHWSVFDQEIVVSWLFSEPSHLKIVSKNVWLILMQLNRFVWNSISNIPLHQVDWIRKCFSHFSQFHWHLFRLPIIFNQFNYRIHKNCSKRFAVFVPRGNRPFVIVLFGMNFCALSAFVSVFICVLHTNVGYLFALILSFIVFII